MNGREGRAIDAARFRELLSAYGADFARWPESEVASARAFLATSRDAARWLEEERNLDAMLDAVPSVDASPLLLRKVAEIPVRHPRDGWLSALARARTWIIGAAAMAAMGLVVGSVIPEGGLAGDGVVVDAANIDDLAPLGWAGDLAEELSP
jgi:hypothetical protein